MQRSFSLNPKLLLALTLRISELPKPPTPSPLPPSIDSSRDAEAPRKAQARQRDQRETAMTAWKYLITDIGPPTLDTQIAH